MCSIFCSWAICWSASILLPSTSLALVQILGRWLLWRFCQQTVRHRLMLALVSVVLRMPTTSLRHLYWDCFTNLSVMSTRLCSMINSWSMCVARRYVTITSHGNFSSHLRIPTGLRSVSSWSQRVKLSYLPTRSQSYDCFEIFLSKAVLQSHNQLSDPLLFSIQKLGLQYLCNNTPTKSSSLYIMEIIILDVMFEKSNKCQILQWNAI